MTDESNGIKQRLEILDKKIEQHKRLLHPRIRKFLMSLDLKLGNDPEYILSKKGIRFGFAAQTVWINKIMNRIFCGNEKRLDEIVESTRKT